MIYGRLRVCRRYLGRVRLPRDVSSFAPVHSLQSDTQLREPTDGRACIALKHSTGAHSNIHTIIARWVGVSRGRSTGITLKYSRQGTGYKMNEMSIGSFGELSKKDEKELIGRPE